MGNRTRFAFSFPLGKKIMVWFPSSREPPAVHRTAAFKWVRVRHLYTNKKREAACLPFLIGAGNRTRTGTLFTARDFKSLVSTDFTMPAWLLRRLY